MSLFGSLMGDYEEDPYFGSQSRAMNHMVNSFFSDPFGDMMGGGMPGMGFPVPSLMGGPMMAMPPRRHQQQQQQIMPFGFPNMGNMGLFPTLGGRQSMGDCHSFSSSTMVSMTTGPDGRPQVYQASSSTRTAPGGVRETKKSVADTRSGTKKLAIGHHIGERGHVIEREQNVYSGDQEERQELINLEEEETPVFNREWEARTRRAMGGVAIEDVTDRSSTYRGHERPLLALPSSTTTSSARSRNRASAVPSSSSLARYHRRSYSVSHNSESSRYSRQLATKGPASVTTALMADTPRRVGHRSNSVANASEVSYRSRYPRLL